MWLKMPDQIKRLLVPLTAIAIGFIAFRYLLVPPDFGKLGHYRASAIKDVLSQEIKYAGQTACADCHEDLVGVKKRGYHREVSCEVCHGPAAQHTEDPENNKPIIPKGREYCPLCHEYHPSRPTGFPQIVSESHNPMKPCIACHEPHDPKPPQIPKGCEACHTQIARTKALSYHVYLPCTRCHEADTKHQTNPREHLPKIPNTREFCGECHSKDATSPKEIPRIDMTTHGNRYLCWQCHYPHLPETLSERKK